MNGVVSAGDEKTAQAGAWILKHGGNAYDATLAAMLAAPLCEPVFTSLGGGGFMLSLEKDAKSPQMYDFFVDVPKKSIGEPEFYPVYVDFKTAIQEFHIGCASAAVPGMVKGIWQIYKDHASLPMETIIQPALKYASEGINLSKMQASFIKLLEPIFTSTQSIKKLFTKDGRLIDAHDTYTNFAYADFLKAFAKEGSKIFYDGAVASNIDSLCKENSGLLSKEALHSYNTCKRDPIHFAYKNYDVYTNPPPSCGGILIAFALKLLENQTLHTPNSEALLQQLVEVQKTTSEFRKEHIDAFIHDSALKDILQNNRMIENYTKSMHSRLNLWGNTTHIAVIDSQGNATSVTTTNGEACGHVIPETGILLNNMLGEEDLNPHGFFAWDSGIRLPSMMAPTALLKDGKPVLLLGSAGSNRIRSAVMQTILNYTEFGMSVQEAITAPRLHVEKNDIFCEPPLDLKMNSTMQETYNMYNFDELNLFFGGVQAVTGDMQGGADPRRGACVVKV